MTSQSGRGMITRVKPLIMSNRNFILAAVAGVLVLFVLCVALLASTGTLNDPLKPSHNGVFLAVDNSLVEMNQSYGDPPALDEIVSTSDLQPLIVMLYPELDQKYLIIRSVSSSGQGPIPFDAKFREGELLDIRPQHELEPGVYCLVQGNPLAPPSNIPYWCFAIGGTVSEVTPSSAVMGPRSEDLDTRLPDGVDGFYLANSGETMACFTQSRDFFQRPVSDLSSFPFTNLDYPVVLLRSDDINLSNLTLKRLIAGLGFHQSSTDNNAVLVRQVDSGHGAEISGMQSGDIILSVDGQAVGDSTQLVHDLVVGQFGEIVQLTLLRGTKTYTVAAPRTKWLDTEDVAYHFESVDAGYVRLIPDTRLKSGLYCYEYQERGNLGFYESCFVVEE